MAGLEERYIVMKVKDVNSALSPQEQRTLDEMLITVSKHYVKRTGKSRYFRSIVVEEDWPEYPAVEKAVLLRAETLEGKEGEAGEIRIVKYWLTPGFSHARKAEYRIDIVKHSADTCIVYRSSYTNLSEAEEDAVELQKVVDYPIRSFEKDSISLPIFKVLNEQKSTPTN